MSNRVSAVLRESLSRLSAAVDNVLPTIAAAVVVFVVFWCLATVARRIARAGTRYVPDPTIRMLITQVSYYLVWAIGFVVTMDTLGLNLQSVVTALGLGTVAIGFALKDILSNLVSGVLILAMGPFEIGDQIVIGDTEGTVERIELRATQIRTYDGRLVWVPNGEVFTSRVTNNTASELRRASVDVYLAYREDAERALAVILAAIRSVTGVATSPAPSMRLREFRPECLHIEARFWADSRRTSLMNTASAVRVAILRALREAGISLPDPDQRNVTVVSTPHDTPHADIFR